MAWVREGGGAAARKDELAVGVPGSTAKDAVVDGRAHIAKVFVAVDDQGGSGGIEEFFRAMLGGKDQLPQGAHRFRRLRDADPDKRGIGSTLLRPTAQQRRLTEPRRGGDDGDIGGG